MMLSFEATIPSQRFSDDRRALVGNFPAVADAKPDYLLILAIAATVILLLAFAVSLVMF